MDRFNTIAVMPVRSLEVGDLFAKEFIGRIVWGELTGKVYAAYQLTDEQRAYMIEHDLRIPDDEHEPIGGHMSYLLFGNFRDGIDDRMDHMYVEMDHAVAVFANTKKLPTRI